MVVAVTLLTVVSGQTTGPGQPVQVGLFPQSLRFRLLCSVNLLDFSDNRAVCVVPAVVCLPAFAVIHILLTSLLLTPLLFKSKRFLICPCCGCGAAVDDVLVPDA